MKRQRNTFFQFKQFTVHQGQTALKVCTEACILGAVADVSAAHTILDIGTGTGLLALMMAQRAPHAQIDAVEIDPDAFVQAQENVRNSPFASQIKVIQSTIQGFENQQLYDCIVSNPPFYQQSLRSPDDKRNQALHAHTLTFDELLEAVGRLLKPQGKLVVLLPAFEMEQFVKKAQLKKLNLHDCLTIKNQPDKETFRQICTFGYEQVLSKNSVLSIKDVAGDYSEAFRALLKEYYLIF